MNDKNYMVVVLPKDEAAHDVHQVGIKSDYDDAFQLLNSYLSEHTEQVFERPRREKPLRYSLTAEYVELWIITRTNDLTTC